jgi:hypothetical protein
MEVRRKIRSCQMIGVEKPWPGTLAFHLMFCVSFHVVGGTAPGARPAPDGPRHVGHEVVPAANAGDVSSAKDARASAEVRRADFM